MWCPKCKVEYRDGITVCADCGTLLVEGSEEDFDVVDICSLKDKAMADRFADYLAYDKLKNIKKIYDEEKGIYTVAVGTAEVKKAERLFEGFMLALEEDAEQKERDLAKEAFEKNDDTEASSIENDEMEEDSMEKGSTEEDSGKDASEEALENASGQEADRFEEDGTGQEASSSVDEEQEYDWDAENKPDQPETDPFEDDGEAELDEGAEDELEDELPKTIIYEHSQTYVKKEDAYKDMLFSGWTFVIFGVLGILYLILTKTGILPIHYNTVVFVGILVMFGLFLIGGIVSIVRSGRIKAQIPMEEKKTAEINAWLQENLTDELVQSWYDKEVTQEENDLLVMAHLKRSLIKEYPQEDASYLEMISEEYFTEHLQGNEDFEE